MPLGASSPERFGVPELLALSRKRWPDVRNVTLAVMAAALVAVIVLPSKYTASAVVMLDPRKNNVAGLSSVLSDTPTDPTSVQNQIQILTSRDLAGEVIQRLDLADDPEINPALARISLNPLWWIGVVDRTPEARNAEVVDAFLKQLSVDSIGLSSAISVKFSSRDPAKAARIANTVVDAYIESQLAIDTEAGRRTTAWLAQRIAELAHQVEVAEATVARYKADHGINDTGDGTSSLVDQQLTAINNQLVQARADLAAKQANYDRIAALVKSGNAADISQVVSSPLIVQLRTQQSEAIRDEAEIVARYGPKHPKRVQAELQLRDLQDKIDLEVARIAGSVANDLSVARAQVKSLEASLAETQAQETEQSLARVQLKALESEAATTGTMYESFVARLRETQGLDVVQMSDARVISHASVPVVPSSPKRLLIIGASLPAGLMLGLLCALLLERMEQAGRPSSTGSRKPLPVLAEVLQARDARAANAVIENPSSSFAQVMLGLARQVIGAGVRIVAVTSPDPRLGQCNVAASLARTLAIQGRRVVLIDTYPPTAAGILGASQAAVSLRDVLAGRAPLSRAFVKDPHSSLLILGAAADVLAPKLADFIAHLRATCDIVIVDGPPIWTHGMSCLAPYTQALLIVTQKSAMDRVAEGVEALNVPLAGCVLTA
jgi:polysaccharide biosynthesis transport protein